MEILTMSSICKICEKIIENDTPVKPGVFSFLCPNGCDRLGIGIIIQYGNKKWLMSRVPMNGIINVRPKRGWRLNNDCASGKSSPDRTLKQLAEIWEKEGVQKKDSPGWEWGLDRELYSDSWPSLTFMEVT